MNTYTSKQHKIIDDLRDEVTAYRARTQAILFEVEQIDALIRICEAYRMPHDYEKLKARLQYIKDKYANAEHGSNELS